MINLISISGKRAKDFYLKKSYQSDFKSLIRTVTSGRVLIISTRFRTDLFYLADEPVHEAILKLWALYTKTDLPDRYSDYFNQSEGDEESLSIYFQAVNRLAFSWFQFRMYKRAFKYTYQNDQQNPVIQTIIRCDRHLVEHPRIKRSLLIRPDQKIERGQMKDTFALAMRILEDESHFN